LAAHIRWKVFRENGIGLGRFAKEGQFAESKMQSKTIKYL
jgi:hypothetical protein